MSLAVQGFTLVKHPVASFDIDFTNDADVVSTYHPAVRELLLRHMPGAMRVVVFDDTRRSFSAHARVTHKLREPSAAVHNDYTARSGLWRLQSFLQQQQHYSPQAVDDLLSRRFCIVNVWRSIRGTVWNWPLVLADATTVPAVDVVAVERHTPTRQGEIVMARYSRNQRWYYYPRMTADEALLIQTFDSGRPCRTIHSSFDDPSAPGDAPARQSMETRCFVFF